MVSTLGFMPRQDALDEPSSTIPLGAPVIDVAGTKIGVVRGSDSAGLMVESGFFFVRSQHVPYATVDRVLEGTVLLKLTKDQLAQEA